MNKKYLLGITSTILLLSACSDNREDEKDVDPERIPENFLDELSDLDETPYFYHENVESDFLRTTITPIENPEDNSWEINKRVDTGGDYDDNTRYEVSTSVGFDEYSEEEREGFEGGDSITMFSIPSDSETPDGFKKDYVEDPLTVFTDESVYTPSEVNGNDIFQITSTYSEFEDTTQDSLRILYYDYDEKKYPSTIEVVDKNIFSKDFFDDRSLLGSEDSFEQFIYDTGDYYLVYEDVESPDTAVVQELRERYEEVRRNS